MAILIIILIVLCVKNKKRKKENAKLEGYIQHIQCMQEIQTLSRLNKNNRCLVLLQAIKYKSITINTYDYDESKKLLVFDISYKIVNGSITFETDKDEFLKLKEFKSLKKFMKYFYMFIFDKYKWKIDAK